MIEIFGLSLQEFIFNIFLPFIFLYLLIYALLRKSKILGETKEANRLNTMLALVISALGIFSLHSLGLATFLPYLAAFTAVAAFAIMYMMGIFRYSILRLKTEEERKFDSLIKDCEEIWKKFKAEKDVKIKEKWIKEILSKSSELKPLAEKLGKSLYEYEWYSEISKIKEEEK